MVAETDGISKRDSFPSPNAIPPRTSSTGLYNSFQPVPPVMKPVSPTKPVLVPVPESDWIASNKQPNFLFPCTASLGSDPPQKPNHSSNPDPRQPQAWPGHKEQILLGPFDYMVNHPGKDIRKQLIAAFNAWLQVPPSSLEIITKVIGMLHTASLLIDDVEDNSLLRRGVPVAHSIFGMAQTINSANYVYFQALQELLKLGNPEVVRIYADELCNLHRGQGMDLFWRDTLTCPSEEDYLEMVGNKTGGLFRLAVKIMQAESLNNETDYIPLVSTIGLLFQIRDDYLNLSSEIYTSNKGLCEDLTEGKFSYPIIHAIKKEPGNMQLINILRMRTKDEEVKKYAVGYMRDRGSFEYCKVRLRELKGRAEDMIEIVDGGRGKGAGVKWILDRLGLE
ncbi:geranylgeranyl pyrophosphate synthetase [Xanthoria calcicola]